MATRKLKRAVGYKKSDGATLADAYLENGLADTRRRNMALSTLDTENFLKNRNKALQDASIEAKKVFAMVYEFVGEMSKDGNEAEKSAAAIASSFRDNLFDEVDKVFPPPEITRVKIDKPIPGVKISAKELY
jgi:hypothetical protein